MAVPRIVVVSGVLVAMTATSTLAWLAGSRIESPAEAAARTAPPKPSPILVPVEKRVLSANIVTRGTARFGLPQLVTIPPSTLKPVASLITALPDRNTQVEEGRPLLTASGRPIFVLQGEVPAYRDLHPGLAGPDVRQLEQGLARLGFEPGPVDGHYDAQTAAAVGRWYTARGWQPFGPTPEQLASLRVLERESGDASKSAFGARAAHEAAVPAVDAARASTDSLVHAASADLAAKQAELQALEASGAADTRLSIESEQAKADHANAAAEAELAAQIADQALVALDPRQPETARMTASAKVELARAAAHKTRLEGRAAVQAAERAAAQFDEKLAQARSAVANARRVESSARLEGEKTTRAAVDAQKLAAFDARLAAERAGQLAADEAQLRHRLGVQVPVDEIVFIRALPVRVEELKVAVGSPATGPVLSVTDNQIVIDAALALDVASLLKPGMPVAIDEQALGVKATGAVQSIAATPGTHGLDGFHTHVEVRVDPTPARLEGVSLRLTIPISSTRGEVTAVPSSAVSLSADGSSRVQVQDGAVLKYVTVTPGLAADGFVEVSAVGARLEPGQLVVVGYSEPKARETK